MIWVIETKDGEPKFSSPSREMAETYFALLNRANKKLHKPEPVPYGRLGQQEMWSHESQA